MLERDSQKQVGMTDAVGYMLVLGIIFASITAVYFVGFDYLETARDIEEDENIERSLSIFLSNEREVVSGDAPSRSTEIKLGNNKASLSSDTSIVEVYLPAQDQTHISESGTIEFGSPEGTFVYEFGGIIKDLDPERETRLDIEPRMILYDSSENYLYIHMLGMSIEDTSVSGGIRDIVLTRTNNSEFVYDFSSSQSIEIYITSPHDQIWLEYFENKDSINDCYPDGTDKIRCDTVSIDGVVIQQADINVEII